MAINIVSADEPKGRGMHARGMKPLSDTNRTCLVLRLTVIDTPVKLRNEFPKSLSNTYFYNWIGKSLQSGQELQKLNKSSEDF